MVVLAGHNEGTIQYFHLLIYNSSAAICKFLSQGSTDWDKTRAVKGDVSAPVLAKGNVLYYLETGLKKHYLQIIADRRATLERQKRRGASGTVNPTLGIEILPHSRPLIVRRVRHPVNFKFET